MKLCHPGFETSFSARFQTSALILHLVYDSPTLLLKKYIASSFSWDY